MLYQKFTKKYFGTKGLDDSFVKSIVDKELTKLYENKNLDERDLVKVDRRIRQLVKLAQNGGVNHFSPDPTLMSKPRGRTSLVPLRASANATVDVTMTKLPLTTTHSSIFDKKKLSLNNEHANVYQNNFFNNLNKVDDYASNRQGSFDGVQKVGGLNLANTGALA